jgi:hypothetical protein
VKVPSAHDIVAPYYSYLEVRFNRKPNWIDERGRISTQAWIGSFTTARPYGFQRRHIFFKATQSDTVIATGTISVWKGKYDGDSYRDLNDFVVLGESLSFGDHETALAVARIWGSDDEDNWWIDDPFCFGDVCVFETLAIEAKTSADTHAVWQSINALLWRLRRNLAVIILRAFSLEFHGKVTDENFADFRRQQLALMRLFRRRLKLEPVAHQELAEEGWMLRIIKKGAEPDSDSLFS